MLRIFRHKFVSKVIFWGLVILIIPAFVIVGNVSMSSKDKRPKYVGIIDNKKVSFEKFYYSLTGARMWLVLNNFAFPDTLSQMTNNRALVARLAWDRLIMLDEARKAHITVSDKDVINALKTHPIFMRGEKFDPRVYDHVLRYMLGLEARAFEELMREHVMINKWIDSMTRDLSIQDEDVIKEFRRMNDKFTISYLLFDPAELIKASPVTEQEARDYFEKNKDSLRIVRKDSPDNEGVKPASFEEAKDTIISHMNSFRSRELAVKAATQKRQELSDLMAKEKLPFSEACAKLNLTPKASKPFGQTDYIEGLGEAVPVVASALELKDGEISAPTETRKGIVLFVVTESHKFDNEKLAKEKDRYREIALNRKKDEFIREWLATAEKMTTLAVDLSDVDKYYR